MLLFSDNIDIEDYGQKFIIPPNKNTFMIDDQTLFCEIFL